MRGARRHGVAVVHIPFDALNPRVVGLVIREICVCPDAAVVVGTCRGTAVAGGDVANARWNIPGERVDVERKPREPGGLRNGARQRPSKTVSIPVRDFNRRHVSEHVWEFTGQ